MKNGIPQGLSTLLDGWRAPQVLLPKVIRWSPWMDRPPGIRIQDCLQHSHSISLLGAMVLAELRKFVPLDESLLLTALIVHDLGEGEIGQDTPYRDKSDDQDLREYLSFRKRYESTDAFPSLHKAFLLQFCLKPSPKFPEDARVIMAEMSKPRSLEALAFEGIERFDYVLFALEQYCEYDNSAILAEVAGTQSQHLDRIARELPGFGNRIWTSEVAGWLLQSRQQAAA